MSHSNHLDSTYRGDHTLNLVLGSDDSDLVNSSSAYVRDLLPTDHLGEFFPLTLRPKNLVQQFRFCRISQIDPASFEAAIKQSLRAALISSRDASSDELMDTHNKALTCILDAHAPMKVKATQVEGRSPEYWIAEQVFVARRARRRCEKVFRVTPSTTSRTSFILVRNRVIHLIWKVKTKCYNNLLRNCRDDPKRLYKVLQSLTKFCPLGGIPPYIDSSKLVNEFATFCQDKVARIRHEAQESQACLPLSQLEFGMPFRDTTHPLEVFVSTSETDIKRHIVICSSSSAFSDPILGYLFKKCEESFCLFLEKIFDTSLQSAHVPFQL